MQDVKQVIIVRADLKMRRGKEAAQVAHASMKVILEQMAIMPERRLFDGSTAIHRSLIYKTDTAIGKWLEGSFTKIVLSCNSEEELFDLYKKAENAKIVKAIIQDNGNTEFKEICPFCEGTKIMVDRNLQEFPCRYCAGTGKINKSTYTALAIGPDYFDKIDKITGGLKLR